MGARAGACGGVRACKPRCVRTIVGLLLGDSSSYLAQEPRWKPTLGVNGVFGLWEPIAFALDG